MVNSPFIHVLLGGNLRIVLIVVVALDIHVVDKPHREQVEIPDGDPKLHTAEQKERRRQRPLGGMSFFLATDWVSRFTPHKEMISGSS